MRKVIIFVSFAIFFWLVFFGSVPIAKACVHWCSPPVCSTGEVVGACSGEYVYTCCDSGYGGTADCDPLHYACNDVSQDYCCLVGGPVGTPVPGQGGCSTGYAAVGGCCDSGGGVCSIGCIPGSCSCDADGNNCGTTVCCNDAAQYTTAVCASMHNNCITGSPKWDWQNADYYYWACQAAGGSTVSCQEARWSCPAGYTLQQTGTTLCPSRPSECSSPSYEEQNDNGCICHVRSCVYTCDINGSWSAWTVCNGNNVSQTRTNSCTGGTQTQACPQVGWWQVKDTDVASGGDVISKAPASYYFDADGDGGYPGVVSYVGSAILKFGGGIGNFSTTKWLANTSTASTRVYDAKYFANQIPADTVINDAGLFYSLGGVPSHGYYWYKYDGSANGFDFAIGSNINIGNKRVVLLIDGANLYLRGKINLIKGQGFFMTVVGKKEDGTKGNIIIDSTVGGGATPNLEGIYLADNWVVTGTGGGQTDSKLYVRGSVAGYGGVSLQRNIGSVASATTPAELFEYAPDQIMLFPPMFGVRRMNWKEVAP